MMRRDNEIDAQKVLRDSHAKIDEVRSILNDLQMRNPDALNPGESLDNLPRETK